MDNIVRVPERICLAKVDPRQFGLLTPPLGISCFVIKSTLNDPNISLKDVFLGSLPFALLMLLVLIVIIQFPTLSTALL